MLFLVKSIYFNNDLKCLATELLKMFASELEETILWNCTKENNYESNYSYLEYELFEYCAEELDAEGMVRYFADVVCDNNMEYDMYWNFDDDYKSVAIAFTEY